MGTRDLFRQPLRVKKIDDLRPGDIVHTISQARGPAVVGHVDGSAVIKGKIQSIAQYMFQMDDFDRPYIVCLDNGTMFFAPQKSDAVISELAMPACRPAPVRRRRVPA